MFNWKDITDDPNDADAQIKWLEYYRSITQEVAGIARDDLIISILRESKNSGKKKILDIGFAEHTGKYIDDKNWFHFKLRTQFPREEVWGVDIDEHLVEYVKNKYGWENLIAYDATKRPFRGCYFDNIHAGDVIEHVSDVGAFMTFCYMSLNPGGRLLITTPNLVSQQFIRNLMRHGSVVANFEHTCWITPTNINEHCRRTGFQFERSIYHLSKKKQLVKKILPHSLYNRVRDFMCYEYIYLLRKLK